MPFWPMAVYFLLVILLVAGMLSISYLLGQRHSAPATNQPYEGGISSEGSAQIRLSPKFYLVAVFFVIFDLETAFILAWAVAARESGMNGYWEMVLFVLVLAATLAYLWRIGALDWKERRGKNRRQTDALVGLPTRGVRRQHDGSPAGGV